MDKYLWRFFYVPGTGNGVAGKKWVLSALEFTGQQGSQTRCRQASLFSLTTIVTSVEGLLIFYNFPTQKVANRPATST